jgi:hypothetical protein
MISHALTIVINELNRHWLVYGAVSPPNELRLGNLAEGLSPTAVPRNMLILSVVNIKEEKTLKNVPHYVRDEVKLSVSYENLPVFLNFQILVTATHENYQNALTLLSRGIRFFQFQNVFTPDKVSLASLTNNAAPMRGNSWNPSN